MAERPPHVPPVARAVARALAGHVSADAERQRVRRERQALGLEVLRVEVCRVDIEELLTAAGHRFDPDNRKAVEAALAAFLRDQCHA